MEGKYKMILALAGVTGVGKSFFKDKLVEKLDFKKVNTIRTRERRKNEKNGIDGIFMSKEELDECEKEGKIAYRFSVFGGEYGYLKEEIFSDDNMIFEMHYTTIDDWKKVREDIVAIYILPIDLDQAKEQTLKRGLSKEKEEERLREIDLQYNYFVKDKGLQDKFDYVFYNNFDEESENKLIELVKEIMNKNKE